jgi:hypothetical protein
MRRGSNWLERLQHFYAGFKQNASTVKESCSTTPKEVFKHQTILHSLQELPAT